MSTLSRIGTAAKLFGIDLHKMSQSLRALPVYLANKRQFYREAAADPHRQFAKGKLYPCLGDRFEEGGSASGHYFHQDLHVATLVYRNSPVTHVDVGSRIDGFVSHVAVFRDIEVLDIRPLTTSAARIHFRQLDVIAGDRSLDAYTDSLSCLHALEHFGLGRYGDPVHYNGHVLGLKNIARMVKPAGRLYLSTPISRTQRFEFDGQRVFALPYLLDMVHAEGLEVLSLAYVDDAGELHADVDWDSAPAQETFGLKYGCGILELKKRR